MKVFSASGSYVALAAIFLLAFSSIASLQIARADGVAGQFHCITGALLGTNETPPNASPATGTIDIIVDTVANDVLFTLSFSNLEGGALAAHIHEAPAGVAGLIKVPLPLGAAAGQKTATTSGTGVPIAGFNVADIVSNPTGFYVNVHSDVFPAGEIRGQLISCSARTVPEFPGLFTYLVLIAMLLPIVVAFRRGRLPHVSST